MRKIGPYGGFEKDMENAAYRLSSLAHIVAMETGGGKPQDGVKNRIRQYIQEANKKGEGLEEGIKKAFKNDQALRLIQSNLDHIFNKNKIEMLVTIPLFLGHQLRELGENTKHLKSILWSGMAMPRDLRKSLIDNYFKKRGVSELGMFGRSDIGPSFLDTSRDDLSLAYAPFTTGGFGYRIEDPHEPKEEVPYGQEGQISIWRLTPELMIVNWRDEDMGERIDPDYFVGDGIKDIHRKRE